MADKSLKIKRGPSLIARKAKNKVILLDPREGKLSILNSTALTIWSFIWKPRTIDEITKKITKEYDLPYDKAEEDVALFIKKSLDLKLVVTLT